MTTSNKIPHGCKVGDRFRFEGIGDYWYIYELKEEGMMVIDSSEGTDIGDLDTYDEYNSGYVTRDKYLGNFSKVDNFDTLYDLLNS